MRGAILPLFSVLVRHIWNVESKPGIPIPERQGQDGAGPAKSQKDEWGTSVSDIHIEA